MNNIQNELNEFALLATMIRVREWEEVNLPELKTLSGRNLYFRIAKYLVAPPAEATRLKLLSGNVSDRATRARIREFEKLGFIHLSENQTDHRSRNLNPTTKYLEKVNLHLWAVKKICSENFVMIER